MPQDWTRYHPVTGTHDLPIPMAVAQLNLSTRQLYTYIQEGKAQAKKHDGVLMISPSEIKRLKSELTQKRARRLLIKQVAEKKGIQDASARRRIQRLEAQGLSFNEIAQRLML